MTEILKGKTLLIVEDEPDLRAPLVEEFESLGCTVREATNGRDAFTIIQSERIDAVISDVRMPGGDGVELLRNIKSLHYAFPVVMLITGFSDLSKEDAYHLGAEAILSKPFDLDDIDAAVVKILTPREERWDGPIPSNVRVRIERTFASLSEAVTSGTFSLGRGGLFLGGSDLKASLGEFVGVHVRFSTGELLVLEGGGRVRWLRPQETSGLAAGIGIEFESLSPDAKRAVITLTDEMEVRPYIPKS